ncbi:hypothetical protein PT974_09324 [Cladobotryum mycophilum]|uniref:Uncharacterized protein n=1 Tax=Cladobotryum mycophilum TaxID=491253 RepID=A0ABR0SFU5_9HYPO
MASRIVSLLLLGLCLTASVTAAPTNTESSLVFSALLAERSVSITKTSNELSILPRIARVFRFDKTTSLPAKKNQAPTYFLDASLGLLEASVDTQSVPVFSGNKDKRVIVDTNGDLLTVTYGGNKFVPVWARPWTSAGFRGALRFSQGLAMFILGSSLAVALVCSYWRSLCPKQDQSEFRDLEIAELGRASEDSIDSVDESNIKPEEEPLM